MKFFFLLFIVLSVTGCVAARPASSPNPNPAVGDSWRSNLKSCNIQSSAHRPEAAARPPVIIKSVLADYDQVWADLTAALNNRGLVISSVSHVGEMLIRTGKALGQTKPIFVRARVMEFCSAVISRKMMEDNPHYIAFCPYQIMVYTLPAEPGRVYLSYRRLYWGKVKNRQSLQRVENLLSTMIKETIETQKEYQ
ncbi:MAG TPA: DUF302 domain-containing protein [Desulfobacterales bacterium]|nr:DUF302 domain-containing protein [Desulfobacterales bacterium]